MNIGKIKLLLKKCPITKQFIDCVRERIFGGCVDMNKSPYKANMCGGGGYSNLYSAVSLIYPFYTEVKEKESDFILMLKRYEVMDKEIKKNLKIILVDDASPVDIEFPDFDLNYSILRIEKNIKWNSGGAKNLGVSFCSTERILITDIDHFFPEETLRWCMTVKDLDCVYCFDRKQFRNGVLEDDTVHPNTFFMTKNNYFLLHGYDEDFCGYYGDDVFFRKYLNNSVEIFNSGKYVYVNNFNGDAYKMKRRINCLHILYKKGLNHSLDWCRFPWKLKKTNKIKT